MSYESLLFFSRSCSDFRLMAHGIACWCLVWVRDALIFYASKIPSCSHYCNYLGVSIRRRVRTSLGDCNSRMQGRASDWEHSESFRTRGERRRLAIMSAPQHPTILRSLDSLDISRVYRTPGGRTDPCKSSESRNNSSSSSSNSYSSSSTYSSSSSSSKGYKGC